MPTLWTHPPRSPPPAADDAPGIAPEPGGSAEPGEELGAPPGAPVPGVDPAGAVGVCGAPEGCGSTGILSTVVREPPPVPPPEGASGAGFEVDWSREGMREKSVSRPKNSASAISRMAARNTQVVLLPEPPLPKPSMLLLGRGSCNEVDGRNSDAFAPESRLASSGSTDTPTARP